MPDMLCLIMHAFLLEPPRLHMAFKEDRLEAGAAEILGFKCHLAPCHAVAHAGILRCMLRAQLLGRPRFWVGPLELTNLSPKATLLLAHLCCVLRPVPRLALERLLWEKDGTQNIRQALRRLKQLEGADSWLVVAPEVAVIASSDLHGVHVALEQGRFEDALMGLRQPLLHFDFDLSESFGQWWQLEQRRWSDLREDALQKLVARAEAQHDLERAVSFQAELCSFDTLSETRHRHLMQLHLQREDREAALAVFEALRRHLAQFGMEPLEETRALLQTAPTKLAARVAQAVAVLKMPDGVSELQQRDVLVIAAMLEVPAMDVLEAMLHSEEVPTDLPEPAKRWWHQRAAVVLETRGEALFRIARHQLEAGNISVAVERYVIAGRAALRERGAKAALRLLWPAFDVLETLGSDAFDLRLEALRLFADIALKNDDLQLAETIKDSLELLARTSQRDEHWFEWHAYQANIGLAFGDLKAARMAGDQAFELIERWGRTYAAPPELPELLERAQLINALIALHTRQPDAEAQLRALIGSTQIELRIRVLNTLAAVLGGRNEYAQALTYLEQSLTWARAHAALNVVAQTLSNLGTLAQQLGDFQRSETYFREAIELWRRLENTYGEVMIIGNLATMHLERGAYGFAWNSAVEAFELAERAGLVVAQLLALRTLATLELRFGRPEAALECLMRHQQLALQGQNQRLHRVGEVMEHVVHALKTPDQPALKIIDVLMDLEREGLGGYAQVMRAWLCLGVREDSSQHTLIERLAPINNAHYQLIRIIAQGIFALRHGGNSNLIETLDQALQTFPSEWRALGYSVLSQLLEHTGKTERSARAMETARIFRAEQLEGLPESQRQALAQMKL